MYTKQGAKAKKELYLKSKTALELILSIEEANEKIFISKKGIKNENGETPELLYMIDDDDLFEKTMQEFFEIPENKLISESISTARKNLQEIAKKVAQYAISPLPKKEHEKLSKAINENMATRQKVIDTFLKLDVSTIPQR